MSNIKNWLFKQHTIGQSWGRFALAGSQIAVLVSTYTMIMVTISAYEPISTWLQSKSINLPFWVFILIIIIPIIIAYFVAWKYLVASFYRSSVNQFMEQNKELVEGLKEITEMNGKIDEMNGKIDELRIK